jgi:hypothetical protein
MLCPYCLQTTSPPVCSRCKEVLPPMYVSRHGNPNGDPAILSIVGFSGHGKTVYLASLLDAMERNLTTPWPNFYRQALDPDTAKTVMDNLAQLRRGELPESTRRNFPRPSIHLLTGMPEYRTRQWLAYDPPGEAFETDLGIEKYAHFVQHARVVLFLVSLPDLREPKGGEMHRLLEMYVLGMARMKAKTKRQHLVVAFTKADILKNTLVDCPTTVQRLNTPIEATFSGSKKNYLAVLRQVSDELLNFTENVLGAKFFVRLQRDAFRSVSYCAVSALGSPPEGGHLTTTMEPRGVVDPLIWVLEKS